MVNGSKVHWRSIDITWYVVTYADVVMPSSFQHGVNNLIDEPNNNN